MQELWINEKDSYLKKIKFKWTNFYDNKTKSNHIIIMLPTISWFSPYQNWDFWCDEKTKICEWIFSYKTTFNITHNNYSPLTNLISNWWK